MFDDNQLKNTIIRLKKMYTPSVVVETGQETIAIALENKIIEICNEVGLQVSCERENDQLIIKNLFFSNN